MLRHSMLLLTVELCRLVVQHSGRFAEKLGSRTYVLNNMNRIMLTVYLCGGGSAKNWPTSGWKLSPILSILECFNFGLDPRCHFSYLSIPSISELV